MFNRLDDGGIERSGVPDAGGAAISDEMKPQLIQGRREVRRVQIVRHHLAAGCKTRLDPGLAVQAPLPCRLRKQPGSHHGRGIRGVGAACNGGYDHGAVRERVVGSGHRNRPTGDVGQTGHGLFRGVQGDAVLRPFRSGDAGLHGAEVKFKHVSEFGVRAVKVLPEALFFRVPFDETDPVAVAA